MNSTSYDVKQIKKLFEVGLHLGHKKNRLHPKAKKFIYRVESGISIIDLSFTAKQIDEAKSFLEQSAKDQKKLLVVATKKVAAQTASDLCKKHDISYITVKWLPGLLTNFETIIKNVRKLRDLKEEKDTGTWNKLVKHERVLLHKELVRLEKLYGGIATLEKRPDILFVVDARKERNAILEAKKTDIHTVAIVDTNANPEDVAYPIVANDDSPDSVNFLIAEIINAYAKSYDRLQKTQETA